MFVRLSVCLSVCPSVSVRDGRALWLYGAGYMDLSLWLDSPMFWAPWHQNMSTYCQPSFSSSTWKRGGVWTNCKLGVLSQERLNLKIEVKLLLEYNRKSYMLHRLAQQRMTLSDLEWSFHALCAISVLAELLVIVWFQRVHCIKHTHRHRHTHRHTQTHKQTHSIIIIISALCETLICLLI